MRSGSPSVNGEAPTCAPIRDLDFVEKCSRSRYARVGYKIKFAILINKITHIVMIFLKFVYK